MIILISISLIPAKITQGKEEIKRILRNVEKLKRDINALRPSHSQEFEYHRIESILKGKITALDNLAKEAHHEEVEKPRKEALIFPRNLLQTSNKSVISNYHVLKQLLRT